MGFGGHRDNLRAVQLSHTRTLSAFLGDRTIAGLGSADDSAVFVAF